MKYKQLKLFKSKRTTDFGGSLLKSNPKTKRPFSPKKAMHIVLKARLNLLKTIDQKVERLIQDQARKHKIKIYNMAVLGNHIHLVTRSNSKDQLSNFLRATSGLISRLFNISKLWLFRPFSRIIAWGKDYNSIKDYIQVNHFQAQGYRRYEARFLMELERGDYG